MTFPLPLRSGVALVLLVLASACSEDTSDVEEPALERTAFELVSGEVESGGREQVTEVPIPESFGSTWIPSNESVELVTVHTTEGEVRAVRFSKPGVETNVRILRDVPAGEYDLVRLTIATEGHVFLRALAGRPSGAVSTELRPRPFPAGAGEGTRDDPFVPRLHELEFFELREATGTFTELVLHMPSADRPVTILGIELVDRSGGASLPNVNDGPRPVAVGGDARSTVGLTPGLVLGFPIEGGGARVAFDAALASGTEAEGALNARLLDRRGRERAARRVELRRAWQTVRFALDDPDLPDGLAGGRVVVEVEGNTRALVAGPRVERALADAPTVLLITSDTHRADHLGSTSEAGFIDTPTLDALAASGITFTNAFSSANVTNPSHVAIMTGVHPRDSGIVNNISTLAPNAYTLAEVFRAAGYMTLASVSAQHLSAHYAGLRQGFDRMSGPLVVPRDGDVSVAILEGWLDESDGLPVFVWLHLFDAHAPYVVPAELERKYYPADRDPTDPARALPLEDSQVPGYLREQGVTDVEYPATQYRAEIHYLDSFLAPFLARPRFVDAVVAFSADHGESLGEQDVWWDHEPLYPVTLHVPLILRWPGAPAGTRVDAPVEIMDLGRTLLDLAGLTQEVFPGRDLRWALDDPAGRRPRFALAAHGNKASMEEDGWFFVMHLLRYESKLSRRIYRTGESHLFELRSDPDCLDDRLVAELPRAKRMRAALIRWLDAAAEGHLRDDRTEVGSEQLEVLQDLGYVGEVDAARARWWNPDHTEPNWSDSLWRRLFEDEEFARQAVEAARNR